MRGLLLGKAYTRAAAAAAAAVELHGSHDKEPLLLDLVRHLDEGSNAWSPELVAAARTERDSRARRNTAAHALRNETTLCSFWSGLGEESLLHICGY